MDDLKCQVQPLSPHSQEKDRRAARWLKPACSTQSYRPRLSQPGSWKTAARPCLLDMAGPEHTSAHSYVCQVKPVGILAWSGKGALGPLSVADRFWERES